MFTGLLRGYESASNFSKMEAATVTERFARCEKTLFGSGYAGLGSGLSALAAVSLSVRRRSTS